LLAPGSSGLQQGDLGGQVDLANGPSCSSPKTNYGCSCSGQKCYIIGDEYVKKAQCWAWGDDGKCYITTCEDDMIKKTCDCDTFEVSKGCEGAPKPKGSNQQN